MAALDIEITEQDGNGGDFRLVGRDLAVVTGWQNMPYLAMFGGNVGYMTPKTRTTNEQNYDYWGNELFHKNQPEAQFNSRTEYVLNTTPLTSGGRQKIENAVKKDLEFMKPFANITVSVSIVSVDKVKITLKVERPGNLEDALFIYIWNGVTNSVSALAPTGGDYSFDYSFDYS